MRVQEEHARSDFFCLDLNEYVMIGGGVINQDQLRDMINRVLWYLHPEIPYSEAATELLMLTAASESHLGTYLEQIHGPACGIFQMEPSTEADIWKNYLEYHPGLSDKIAGLMFPERRSMNLTYNLAYQMAMARVHYRRKADPLPQLQRTLEGEIRPDSVHEMAGYWKKHFNTHLGRGTVAKAVEKYYLYAQGENNECV
jgi:hypothetical protein